MTHERRPSTEAGRLLAEWELDQIPVEHDEFVRTILAIEAQAKKSGVEAGYAIRAHEAQATDARVAALRDCVAALQIIAEPGQPLDSETRSAIIVKSRDLARHVLQHHHLILSDLPKAIAAEYARLSEADLW